MTSPAIHSRAFQPTGFAAVVSLLKELFRATPLYLFVSGVQSKPGNLR
jgi:hypothetical protein